MPKTTNNSSIKTIWENNSDTPITATNLSKALDLIASYKNFNTAPVGMEDFHGEYSLLVINPIDSSQLLFKRASVLQIINEAKDDLGNPIIPVNTQYKIFDVGLDDIILTPNDTDITLIGDKSEWGGSGETKQWFVYLADKDDSSIYNKETPTSYGGGAQIIISRNNNGPYRSQVPGRPLDEYSEEDTRIIGGFTTQGDTIVEVWDIAGKFYEVKSKQGYFILDEYSGSNSYNYRRIDFRDLNTNRNSQLDGSITVHGTSNLIGGISASGNINITTNTLNVSSTDTITVGGNIQQTGNLSVTGTTTLNGALLRTGATTHSGPYNLTGTYTQTGELRLQGHLNQTGRVTLGLNNTTPINSTGTWTHNGLFDHSGVYRIQGSVEVTGNYELVSDQLTIRTKTPFGYDGGNPLYQFFQFIVPDPYTGMDPVAASYADPSIYTYHQGRMEVNGGTYSHGGNASFSINWTGNSEMTVFANEYEYRNGGPSPYGGYNIISDFRVKKNNAEPIIEVGYEDKTTSITGMTSFTIEDGDTITVSGDGVDILTVEKDPSRNVIVNGDITVVNGSMHGSVTGNADTASNFQTPLTLDFADVTSDMSSGEVTFSGDESNIKVDLVIDRDRWYDKSNLDPSPGTSTGTGVLDTRYYKISSIDPNPGSDSGTGILDTRYLTISQVQSLFSGGGDFNLEWGAIANRPTINLTGGATGVIDLSNNASSSVDVTIPSSGHNHNETYYTKSDLAQATGDDNGGLVPEINWGVISEIPYGTGVRESVAQADHTHTITLNKDLVAGPNITLDNYPLSLNVENSLLNISSGGVSSVLVIKDVNLLGQYFIIQTSTGFVKFWFDMSGTDTEPDYIGQTIARSIRIDVSSAIELSDYLQLTAGAIGTDSSGDMSTNVINNDIVINFETEIVFDINFPAASDTDYLDFGPLKNSSIFVFMKTDFVLEDPTNPAEIEVGDNFVLTKDSHLRLEHRFITSSKDQFLLDSTSSDFLNISPPSGHASEMYSQIRELSSPSTYAPEMFDRRITDKVAIHANNIYVPTDYTPGVGSLRDYLDVTSTLDLVAGQVTSYSINDTPILQYIESNYYTKAELDGGAIDAYYTKTALDGGVLDTRYYTESEVDGQITNALSGYVTTTWLDNNYYNQSEVYTKTELDGGQLDGRYFTETEITNDYYDKTHIDTYHYTAAEVDSGFQEKETSNWGTNTPEEFLYARVFVSGRPTNPQSGDIHIDGSLVEICVDASVPFWTQLSN